MKEIINIFVILLCVGLLYQDFRERRISIWMLAALFVLLLSGEWTKNRTMDFQNTGLNIGYIFLLYLLLTVYFSVKERRFVNILDSLIGIGDFLFLLAITPAFSFPGFVIFTTVGLILSLIVYGAMYLLMKNKSHREIPLAGVLSGLFAVVLIISAANPDILIYKNDLMYSLLNL